MSWQDLMTIIVEEAGPAVGLRIEARLRHELAGERITIRKTSVITPQDVDAAAPGQPKEAARRLGVHQSTIYRALRRTRIIR